MGIYLSNMKLPKNGDYLFSFASDENDENTIVRIENMKTKELILYRNATEVPPHCRLIDADTPVEVWDIGQDGVPHTVKTTVSRFLLGHLNGAVPPTIIEAEES